MEKFQKADSKLISKLERGDDIVCCKEHPREHRATKGTFCFHNKDTGLVQFKKKNGEYRNTTPNFVWIKLKDMEDSDAESNEE